MSADGSERSTPEERAQQRERLARWLLEWRLDQALASGQRVTEAPAPTDDFAGATDAPLESEPAPATGQIRLLAPVGEATAARPRLVAVIECDAQGRWLVAPFGRFADPALSGEWATGRDQLPLRVLCLWNARWVGADSVRLGWVVGQLTPEERAAAQAVLAAGGDTASLPDALRAQVGPPLGHPDDPRLVYRERERVVMDGIVREWAAHYWINPDQRLAAEPPHPPYGE